MDARGPPAEDLTSFLNGLEFGLAAIRGRLKDMEDPTRAELFALVEEYREMADRIREADGPRIARSPRPRRRR